MKRFLLLSLISVSAHAACDYEIRDRMFRTPEQQRVFRCELNFKCVEAAIRNPNSSLDELDALAEYSRENKCNDELRLADLFATLMEEENGEEDDIAVDDSDRGNAKTDLPLIPDAPAGNTGSKVHRE